MILSRPRRDCPSSRLPQGDLRLRCRRRHRFACSHIAEEDQECSPLGHLNHLTVPRLVQDCQEELDAGPRTLPNGQRISGERRAEGDERVRCMRVLGGPLMFASSEIEPVERKVDHAGPYQDI